MTPSRPPYPSDGSDDEWAFVAPSLTLLPEDAGQRTYGLREVFNGLRWIMRTGALWRMMPHNLPPWWADRLITLLTSVRGHFSGSPYRHQARRAGVVSPLWVFPHQRRRLMAQSFRYLL
jgi:transposase